MGLTPLGRATEKNRFISMPTGLASANAAAVEAVLLEELGHAIDRRLNDNHDTAGDEGASFSALIRNRRVNPSELNQNDHSELLFSG